MATEENVNPTEGQEQENDYRETLLVRNPDSGQVEAVSKLVTKGDRREVHTVQPLAKNRPAFYSFRSSNAVAAFIRGFKSQKDNPIQFQFLKVHIKVFERRMRKVYWLSVTFLILVKSGEDRRRREYDKMRQRNVTYP